MRSITLLSIIGFILLITIDRFTNIGATEVNNTKNELVKSSSPSTSQSQSPSPSLTSSHPMPNVISTGHSSSSSSLAGGVLNSPPKSSPPSTSTPKPTPKSNPEPTHGINPPAIPPSRVPPSGPTHIYSCPAHTQFHKYRLGDMVRGESQRDKEEGREFHFKAYPDSIASEYMRRTNESFQYQILNDIVDERIPNVTFKLPSPTTLLIHMRIGDVIDYTCFKTEQYLKEYTPYVYGIYYVRPLSYYKDVIKQIKIARRRVAVSKSKTNLVIPRAVRELASIDSVILIGGFHKLYGGYTKSYEYIAGVHQLFEQHNFTVYDRINCPPDDDFLMFCSSQFLLPTGGGFSALLTVIVKMRDGIVIEPNSHPPPPKTKQQVEEMCKKYLEQEELKEETERANKLQSPEPVANTTAVPSTDSAPNPSPNSNSNPNPTPLPNTPTKSPSPLPTTNFNQTDHLDPDIPSNMTENHQFVLNDTSSPFTATPSIDTTTDTTIEGDGNVDGDDNGKNSNDDDLPIDLSRPTSISSAEHDSYDLTYHPPYSFYILLAFVVAIIFYLFRNCPQSHSGGYSSLPLSETQLSSPPREI